jgi:hypothetical protein
MNRGLALWASLAFFLALFVTASVVAMFPPSASRVVQPTSIALTLPAPSSGAAPVDLPAAVVGTVTHSSLTRGGHAATSTDAGGVSVRFERTARTQPSSTPPQTLPTVSKKAPRPALIGGVGEGSDNGDAGLATAGSQTQTAGGSRAQPAR